jgi:ABC-2 type transport system permease protein
MENLLSMPITPFRSCGKIIPYVLVGVVQATMIISIGVVLFGVPIFGSLIMLALLSTLLSPQSFDRLRFWPSHKTS